MIVEQVKPNPNAFGPGIYFFYGLPKVGKTTGAVGFGKNALLIDTDYGADEIACQRVIVQYLNVPTRMEKNELIVIPPEARGFYRDGIPIAVYSMSEAYKFVASDEGAKYDTVIIDTLDAVNVWAEEATCKAMKIDAMGQGDYGADWAMAREKVVRLVKRFEEVVVRKRGGKLILIAHAKQSAQIDAIRQRGSTLPRGLANTLAGMSKAIGYVFKKRGDHQPYVTFENYSELTGGSRIKALADIVLPYDYNAITDHIKKYVEE